MAIITWMSHSMPAIPPQHVTINIRYRMLTVTCWGGIHRIMPTRSIRRIYLRLADAYVLGVGADIGGKHSTGVMFNKHVSRPMTNACDIRCKSLPAVIIPECFHALLTTTNEPLMVIALWNSDRYHVAITSALRCYYCNTPNDANSILKIT